MASHRSVHPPPAPGRLSYGKLASGLLAASVVVALVATVPGERSRACAGARVEGWRADDRMTEELARYGNDNGRPDDWTGGDGSRSVRLPGGRTLWMSADTFLDTVHGGRSRAPGPVWVRNAGLVFSPDGTPRRTLLGQQNGRTLLGQQNGRTTALFAGTATEDGREVWRWPVQAVVEPRGRDTHTAPDGAGPGPGRAPGAATGGAASAGAGKTGAEQVVRVLLWQRAAGSGPWIFGVPRATEVATFSLPGLELEGIRTVHRAPQPEPARRVLYGTSAVTEGGWTYVFGADEGTVGGKASRAHVARVPVGRLDERHAWQYWAGDGTGWQEDPARSAPILVGKTPNRGATGTYSVVRHGDSWLLLTMDAGGPEGRGMSDVVSYWACSPTGPWHGPAPVAKPPLPRGGREAGAVPYNPQGHPGLGPAGTRNGGGARGQGRVRGDELLLSYDVNVLSGDTGAIHRNVDLYRPRFLRLELGTVRGAP